MRTALLTVAALALGASSALAGPSENRFYNPGDVAFNPSPEARRVEGEARTPYALTGERPQRRVTVWKDLAGGRGQLQHGTPVTSWVAE